MNLYSFLIIDEEIIEKHFKAYINCDLNGKMELNRNRVYRYVNGNVKLYFMSFLYPNSISDDIWAYTIIDENMIPFILKRENKYQAYRWGTVLDKKGKRLRINVTSDYNTDLIKYIRTGGHISVGDSMRLHEFVFCGGDKSLVSGINRKKRRIHHKGHVFDNRKEYLLELSIAKHRDIHKKWEVENGYHRPKEIGLWHEDMKNLEVDNDIAVLYIKSVMQFELFIKGIYSSEYTKLKRVWCYR